MQNNSSYSMNNNGDRLGLFLFFNLTLIAVGLMFSSLVLAAHTSDSKNKIFCRSLLNSSRSSYPKN